jgi:hypothetical protein
MGNIWIVLGKKIMSFLSCKEATAAPCLNQLSPQILAKITSFLSCKETANLAMTSSRLNRLSTRMVWVVDRFFCQEKPPEHLNVHFVFPKLIFKDLSNDDVPRMLRFYPVGLRCCYDCTYSQKMSFWEIADGFYVIMSKNDRNKFGEQPWFFSKPIEETDPTKFVHEVILQLYQVRHQ